jgi:phosphotransacetylase
MFGVEPVMAMVSFSTLGLPQIQCIKVREAVVYTRTQKWLSMRSSG